MNPDRHRCLTLAALAALCVCGAVRSVGAEDAPGPATPAATAAEPANSAELTRLEGFLDQHPNIAERLRENPTLTENAAFQKNHPQLFQFLSRHPGIAAELRARPRWFIHRELYLQSGGQLTRVQLAEFDRFLDQHAPLEKQLRQRPRLLRQSEFINSETDLREFVRQHPAFSRGDAKPERLRRFERKN